MDYKKKIGSLKGRNRKNNNMPDKNGYPTDSELKRIKDWSYRDVTGLIDYLRDIWWHGEKGIRLKGKRVLWLELHTWGWSGNESIIESLRESFLWTLWWRRSDRGGHYYFKIRRNR